MSNHETIPRDPAFPPWAKWLSIDTDWTCLGRGSACHIWEHKPSWNGQVWQPRYDAAGVPVGDYCLYKWVPAPADCGESLREIV